MEPPVPDNYLAVIPLQGRKLQYGLPTEILQAILLELAAIGDAKAFIRTCRTVCDAFKGYKKTITWTILCRELGTTSLCTIGALAIFASPRKGPEDEPLSANRSISCRYWVPMLMEHGKRAKELITLSMADHMVSVYRKFPEEINYSASGECSACASSRLPKKDWDPREEDTDGNCLEHLLHANAVHFRLNCRMIIGYKRPAHIPRGGF